MSFLDDVTAGFAALIATDADPALGIAWQPTGVYPAGGTGIYIAAVPATPDRIVTLTLYGLGDDPVHADSSIGLQVRTRAGADPRDVEALDDGIADVLLGRFPFTLPTGVRVQTLTRPSSTILGRDATQRWSWVSNYPLGLHRPALHRL